MTRRTKDPHALCRRFTERERERHASELRERDSKIQALESANKSLRDDLEHATMEGAALFLALRLTRERAGKVRR